MNAFATDPAQVAARAYFDNLDDPAPPREWATAEPGERTPWVKKYKSGRFVHEIVKAKPKRDWLLKGVFLARTFFLVVGAPGCGKSFLIFDFAMTRARAVVDPDAKPEWFGQKLKPGATIYIAGEGQEDFAIRAHAWVKASGLPADIELPLFIIPTPVDFRTSDAGVRDLICDIKGVADVCAAKFNCGVDLIIVDTLNKALAGGDDTKPDHVGALIKHGALIREETGAAVGFVHHTPRDGNRARGHGSLTGDNDAEIFVTGPQDGQPNSWKVTRNKAGPAGAKWEFRLHARTVGKDDDGDDITSCVVGPLGSEPSIEAAEMYDAAEAARVRKPQFTPDGRAILGDNVTTIMRALQRVIDDGDEKEPPFGVRVPHGRKAVSEGRWLDEIMRLMPGRDGADAAAFKERCRKARDRAQQLLHRRGIIGVDSGWVWRTDRRVASVDRASPSAQGGEASETDVSASASGAELSFALGDTQ